MSDPSPPAAARVRLAVRGAAVLLGLSIFALAGHLWVLWLHTMPPAPAHTLWVWAPARIEAGESVVARAYLADNLGCGVIGAPVTLSTLEEPPRVVARSLTDRFGHAVVELAPDVGAQDHGLAIRAGKRGLAKLHFATAAPGTGAPLTAEAGGLRIELAHESGVPVAGVPNRYRMRVSRAGRPVPATIELQGWEKATRTLRTSSDGVAEFVWDPAQAGGYAIRGFGRAPWVEATVRGEDAAGGTVRLRFDPLRPALTGVPFYRPWRAWLERGGGSPARFLLRAVWAAPQRLRIELVGVAPGGGALIQAFVGNRVLAESGLRTEGAVTTTELDLPADAPARFSLWALRVTLRDGSAWDERVIERDTGEDCFAIPRPQRQLVHSTLQALEDFQHVRDDREEQFRRSEVRAIIAGGAALLLWLAALQWGVPGLLLRRMGRSRLALGWWLIVPLWWSLFAGLGVGHGGGRGNGLGWLTVACVGPWCGAVVVHLLAVRERRDWAILLGLAILLSVGALGWRIA